MFMRFVGMGIGHQDGSANTNISDDMDCDPDACEESEEYGDDEIRPGQGPNEDVGEGEDEEDIEDKEEEEEEDQLEDDQDSELSEDDIGYDDL
jgi:hypothetical protein